MDLMSASPRQLSFNFEYASSPPECLPSTPTNFIDDAAYYGFDGTAIKRETPTSPSKQFYISLLTLLTIEKPLMHATLSTMLARLHSASYRSIPLSRPPSTHCSIPQRVRSPMPLLVSMAAMLSKSLQAPTTLPTLTMVLASATFAMAASTSLSSGLTKRRKPSSSLHTKPQQISLSPRTSSCLHQSHSNPCSSQSRKLPRQQEPVTWALATLIVRHILHDSLHSLASVMR